MTQQRRHWLTSLSPAALLAYGGCCALAVALMLALADDVTGLPKRSLAFLIASGVIALGLGGYRWVDEARRRPKPLSKLLLRRAAIAVVVVAVALPAGIFALYSSWHSSAGEICEQSRWAETKEQREAVLALAEPYIKRMAALGESHIACDDAARELSALQADQSCPMVLTDSLSCRCAGAPWPKKLSCKESEYPACAYDDGPNGNAPSSTKVIFCRNRRLSF